MYAATAAAAYFYGLSIAVFCGLENLLEKKKGRLSLSLLDHSLSLSLVFLAGTAEIVFY